MVKCIELYEFLEKHGKICGMSDRALREGLAYYNEYRKEAEAKGDETILSEDAWKKAKRRLNERNGKNLPKIVSKESVVDESDECCCCSGELPQAAKDAVDEQITIDNERNKHRKGVLPDRTNREEIEECIHTLELYEFDEDIIRLVKHNAIKVIAKVELEEKMGEMENEI